MKALIMTIGASGSGKSTLSRLLIGGAGQEYVIEIEAVLKGLKQRCRVRYAIGLKAALAGGLKNGSDSISAMDALRQIVDHCWRKHEVTITDGLRCTCKLVDWVHRHPLQPAALFVHLAPPLAENIQRLRRRRLLRGIVEPRLPDRLFWHVFEFRARARMVWNYALQHYTRQPVRFLEIRSGTPEDAAKRVMAMLRELRREEA